MRFRPRLSPLLLAPALAWAIAVGMAAGADPTVKRLAPPVADPVANRVAVQAVLDSLPYNGPSLVDVPAGAWRFDRPLRLSAHKVTFRGLGPQLSTFAGVGYRDVLVLGVNPRVPDPANPAGPWVLKPADKAHFPDAFGVLDTSAAPAPGARRGFRTLGICQVAQAGGGFDQGSPKDRWYANTRVLLIEACLDLSKLNGQGFSLAGMRDGGPRPWSLVWYGSDPTRPYLRFGWRTRPNGDPGEGVVREALIPVPAGLGPVARITVCLDLDAGRLDCFLDDRRAAFNLQGPAVVAGESLASNDWSHFGLGGVGIGATAGHDEIGGDGDVGIFGFRVGNGSPYATAGPTLARKDGQPINDRSRYFREGADLIALLPGTDPVDEMAAERRLTILSGNGLGGLATDGYVVDRTIQGNPFVGCQDVRIENLGLVVGGAGFGDALKLAACAGLHLEKCDLIGGARGLACFNWAATYPLSGRDLQADGRHSSFHLFMTSGTTFSDVRAGMSRGEQKQIATVVLGGATFDGLFSPQWGRPDYAVYGRRAALDLRRWQLDNEGPGQGVQVADIYCWPLEDNQPSSPVAVDDWQSVNHGPAASAVILAGPPPRDNHRALIGDATLRVRNLGVHRFSALRSLVRVLPGADGLWRDAGVDLGATKRVRFEGPPLLSASDSPAPAPAPAAAAPPPAPAPGVPFPTARVVAPR